MCSGLNLRILPLSVVEDLVPQKCLLPKAKLPTGILPGSWVRAIRSGNISSICRVFTRDGTLHGHSYLDRCVTTGDSDEMGELEGQTLERVELLRVAEQPATEIQVIFTVTERFFRRKLSKLTLSFLADTVELLQSLHLVSDCTVRLPGLQRIGIAAMHVQLTKGDMSSDDAVFHVDPYTSVTVGDVRLQCAALTSGPFYTCGFERPRQELQDVIQLAVLQRNSADFLQQPLNALIVGDAGCGKSSLIADVIRANKCNCFRVSASDVVGQYPGETEGELRRIFEAAQCFERQLKAQAPTVILLEDLHLLCPPLQPSDGGSSSADVSNALRTISQLLALVDQLHYTRSSIICLATTSSAEALDASARRAGRFAREIAISRPTAAERRRLFAALWGDSYMQTMETVSAPMLDLVEQQTHGYVVVDLLSLIRAMEQALLRARPVADRPPLATLLKETLTRMQPSAARGAAINVTRTTHGFDTIGGMQQLKRTLQVAVLAALQQREAFQRFGLSAPKGVLLYGPPGCAKTTIARCLAKEANYNFIHTTSAEVYSPYVGCAERFVAQMFDVARKNAPCIIFLDEIDALVGRRVSEASDVQVRILSTLLTEMDGIIVSPATMASTDSHILVVAATNRPDMIDDALLRPGRFDKHIYVPPPDADSRLGILQLHQARMPFASDVNVNDIAERTVRFSGADMCNICNEAALAALQRDFDATEITGADFERVLAEQQSSLTQQQIDWFVDYKNGISH